METEEDNYEEENRKGLRVSLVGCKTRQLALMVLVIILGLGLTVMTHVRERSSRRNTNPTADGIVGETDFMSTIVSPRQ